MSYQSAVKLLFFSFFVTTGTLVKIFVDQNQAKPAILGSANSVATSVIIGGRYHFTIWGYTSPKAVVTLETSNLHEETEADNKGRFSFNDRFLPTTSQEPCLLSRDQFGRMTSPVCLPPLPTTYDLTIGPVLMPPTLSLNHNFYSVGDTVILSGQSIPSTKLDLSTFTNEKKTLFSLLPRTIISPVEAFSFPAVQAKTDNKGNFSFQLPSSNSKDYRLFAQTIYQTEKSPKSIVLDFKVEPWWMIIVHWVIGLISAVFARLLEFIILAELIFLSIYCIRELLLPHILPTKKSLMIPPDLALAKT
ncbi:hypothetical protein HY214_01985 [Candidatus Roizmanbacteria bacterium]|nr:hypothetical protein [Candidatus Roizmanbacteria bacterium]